MKGHFSLRRRVTLIAFLLLLCTSIILIFFMNSSIERATGSAYDRLLLASARTIANAVQTDDGQVVVELPTAAFSMFSGEDRIFYIIRDANGNYVTGYPNIDPKLPLAQSSDETYSDIIYNHEPIRLVTVGRLIAHNDASGWVTIRVGQTRQEQMALKGNILRNEILAITALTILSVLIVWLGVGLIFRPLRKLERELRQRDPSDLAPLASPAPSEINELVAALNIFMDELDVTTTRMRDLVADAAHQIRTPLASLRSQIEVAVHEKNDEKLRERLLKIQRNAVHTSQLVSQLLMDATIAHRLQQGDESEVDLDRLIDDVINRLDMDAHERLKVNMAPQTRDVTLWGDRLALREMLRNIIENALLYSSDKVKVEIGRDDKWLNIRIIDKGPGIVESERDIVLQRFKRGSNAQDSIGSGLGLPIALQVIKAHHGSLQLQSNEDGIGLCVEIKLPISGIVGVADNK